MGGAEPTFFELSTFATTAWKFTDDTANEGSYETRRFLLISFWLLWDYGLMLRRRNQTYRLIGRLIEKMLCQNKLANVFSYFVQRCVIQRCTQEFELPTESGKQMYANLLYSCSSWALKHWKTIFTKHLCSIPLLFVSTRGGRALVLWSSYHTLFSDNIPD